MSMTGVGDVAEPRNNTRGAFSNTPTLWNQDWSGVVGFRPSDSRVQGEAPRTMTTPSNGRRGSERFLAGSLEVLGRLHDLDAARAAYAACR